MTPIHHDNLAAAVAAAAVAMAATADRPHDTALAMLRCIVEATLAGHAESDSEESMRLCREAEESVEAAFLAIGVAFDKAD